MKKLDEDFASDPLLASAPFREGFKVLDPAVLYAKVGAGGMGRHSAGALTASGRTAARVTFEAADLRVVADGDAIAVRRLGRSA